jgi:sporulation protein YlmC with PRC-barrel domain
LRTLRPVRRVFYGLWQKQGTSPQYDIKEKTMISQIFNPAKLRLLKKFGDLTAAPLAAKLANSTCTSDQVVTAGQKSVTRSVLSSSLAACFFVALAAPPVMAEATSGSAANQCLTDLRAFNSQMQKDGYWLGGYGGAADPALGGYGYGYGYPLDGSGYGAGVNDSQGDAGASYLNARPGYEIRSLLAAADILARHEQIQPCEGVLAATRDQYKQYVADMGKAGMKMTNVPGWQLQQIAAAQPVASTTSAFRSDQLLGTDVRNPQNEALGSIDDVATSPQTGKIAYLLVARGGWLFGIGEHYVAVPWGAFKVAPNATLLVLNATKSVMDAAPQANPHDFTAMGQHSQEVDAYWKALVASPANN